MAGFLYYLPCDSAPDTVEELEAEGLGYAFDRASAITCRHVVTQGPDGNPGFVVGDDRQFRGVGPGIGYFPDAQTWCQVPDELRPINKAPLQPASELWVGYFKARPPSPAELLREQPLQGHDVALGDGNDWTIPAARSHTEQGGMPVWLCALPSAVSLDEHGKWGSGSVVEAYAALWALAERWWDTMHAAVPDQTEGAADTVGTEGRIATAEFEFTDAVEGAVLALATNYRVGPVEVSARGLLSDSSVREVLQALVDWPTLQRWTEKKTRDDSTATPAGSSSSDGLADATRPTGRP